MGNGWGPQLRRQVERGSPGTLGIASTGPTVGEGRLSVTRRPGTSAPPWQGWGKRAGVGLGGGGHS